MTMSDIIDQKIRTHLEVELLEVINESPSHQVPPGAQTHFRLLIVSKDFKGLSTLERHRRVYQILNEELKNGIHALCQQTFTLEEWRAISPSTPLASSPPCHKKN